METPNLEALVPELIKTLELYACDKHWRKTPEGSFAWLGPTSGGKPQVTAGKTLARLLLADAEHRLRS